MWSCYIAIIYYFKRTTIQVFVLAVLFISPQAVHEGSGFPISSPALVILGECDAVSHCDFDCFPNDCDVQARLHGLGDPSVSGEVSMLIS